MGVGESVTATGDKAVTSSPTASTVGPDIATAAQPVASSSALSDTSSAHMPAADTDANALVAAQARRIAELEAQLTALKPITDTWLAHPDAPAMLLVRDQPAWRCDAFRHCLSQLLMAATADDAPPALTSPDASGITTSSSTRGQQRRQGRKDYDPETIERVVAAFEYLLSDDYLAKDKYLRALIDEDTHRSVNINYLSNMASIRELNLARPELETIMRRHAKSVEFIGQSRRIRRIPEAPSSIAPKVAASPAHGEFASTSAAKSATAGSEASAAIPASEPEIQPSSPPADQVLSSDSSDNEAAILEQPTLCTGFVVFLDPQLHLDHIRTTVDTSRIYLGPYEGQYGRDTLDVLGAPSQSAYERALPPNICFNCGSPEHVISQCPVSRNDERIERNVALFRAHQPETYSGRYYIDFEALNKHEIRLATFIPGKLSKPLREALGLVSEGTEAIPGVTQGTPEFVKRMERFGYPPSYVGTTPDQDPLLPAKTHQPSFTPLKMYTGAELTSAEPPTPPKESPAPTTYYPLVSYPGLDNSRFDFTTTPLGAPKFVPAIWDHSAAPARPSPNRNEFLDDNFSSLLSSYHDRGPRSRTNHARGYSDRYDYSYGYDYDYDYDYDFDRRSRSSRERSARSHRPYTRYRSHGTGQTSSGGTNGGDYYRPNTGRYRPDSPPSQPRLEPTLQMQPSTGPLFTTEDGATTSLLPALKSPAKAAEPTDSDLEDGELDMDISD
ncbi:hypothetical protein H4R35_000765 [Dimargaris xerosporica]|nr:hypothetical protein H4R35_000765 [Dimargaris xerosporica]